MRNRCWIWVCIFIAGALCSTGPTVAQGSVAAEQFFGTWTRTWDGAGSGGFELTFEKDQNGDLSGKVSATGEPTYTATFGAIAFEGSKMTARYGFPPDDRADVVLEGLFEGTTAKGTWSLREKSNDSEVASGNWTVTKK